MGITYRESVRYWKSAKQSEGTRHPDVLKTRSWKVMPKDGFAFANLDINSLRFLRHHVELTLTSNSGISMTLTSEYSTLVRRSLWPARTIAWIFMLGAILSLICFLYQLRYITAYDEYFPNRLSAICHVFAHLIRGVLLTWLMLLLFQYVMRSRTYLKTEGVEILPVATKASNALRAFAISLFTFSLYASLVLVVPTEPSQMTLFSGGGSPVLPVTPVHDVLDEIHDLSFRFAEREPCEDCKLFPERSRPDVTLLLGPPILSSDKFESIQFIANPYDNYSLQFVVKREYQEEWNSIIRESLGRTLVVVMNGEIIASPVLKAELGSEFVLQGAIHPEDFGLEMR